MGILKFGINLILIIIIFIVLIIFEKMNLKFIPFLFGIKNY